MKRKPLVIVAVGGNSLIKKGQVGTLPEQLENARETSSKIAEVIADGWNVVITHGNGPQVGNILLRSDLARHVTPVLPLDICDAHSQGGIGYLLQQTMRCKLDKLSIRTPVVTLVTQVLVDPNDPAFKNPTKPIGPFFTKERAEEYKAREGWTVVEDSSRGYRRVVPSPKPEEILELDSVKSLIKLDCVVIAAGGGGIPVAREADGELYGVEAVVDKDFSSSLLATALQADLFLISTTVEKVALNYNKPNQKNLDYANLKQARVYLGQGHFAPGSMRPKIEAVVEYLEKGGTEAIITSPDKICESIGGKAGTHFTID